MPADFTPYRKLSKHAREISFFASSTAALTWDLETYMPPKAPAFRAEQLAYLGSEAHRRFTAKNPSLEGELAQGEYGNLLQWLRTKIHLAGSRYSPQELMNRATGNPTQSVPHLDYLRRKFAGV